MLGYSWSKEVTGRFYSSLQHTNFSQHFKRFDGWLLTQAGFRHTARIADIPGAGMLARSKRVTTGKRTEGPGARNGELRVTVKRERSRLAGGSSCGRWPRHPLCAPRTLPGSRLPPGPPTGQGPAHGLAQALAGFKVHSSFWRESLIRDFSVFSI